MDQRTLNKEEYIQTRSTRGQTYYLTSIKFHIDRKEIIKCSNIYSCIRSRSQADASYSALCAVEETDDYFQYMKRRTETTANPSLRIFANVSGAIGERRSHFVCDGLEMILGEGRQSCELCLKRHRWKRFLRKKTASKKIHG